MRQQLRLASGGWGAAMLALVVALALSGCGAGPSTAQTPTETPYPTYSSPPTQTPTHTLSPTADPNGPGNPRPCSGSTAAALGDLSITPPDVLYGFNDDYLLPSDLPTDKPLTVTVQQGASYIAPGHPLENGTVIGPQGAAFVITVCNISSSRSHTLTSFGVKLASATPYTGNVYVLNACAFLYSRPTGFGGECASGYSPDIQLSFQAPASTTPVTQAPPTLVTLAPGYGLDVSFSINRPSNPEIATYHLGVGVDGAPVAFPPGLTTQPSLNAAVGMRWAGDYCSTSQMQAQIPATIPASTYYVCPQQ